MNVNARVYKVFSSFCWNWNRLVVNVVHYHRTFQFYLCVRFVCVWAFSRWFFLLLICKVNTLSHVCKLCSGCVYSVEIVFTTFHFRWLMSIKTHKRQRYRSSDQRCVKLLPPHRQQQQQHKPKSLRQMCCGCRKYKLSLYYLYNRHIPT